jgi:hypothetical protein
MGSPVLAVGLALACASEAPIGDEPGSQTGDRPEAGVRGPSLGDAPPEDAGSDAPTCELPKYPDDGDLQPFSRLEARVVDERGRPVPDIMAQACGFNLCLFGSTDTQGRVVHASDEDMAGVAFKYGDGLRYAQLAFPLGAGPEHVPGDQVTVALPDVRTGMPFEPGTTLSSSGVELALAQDAVVTVNVFDFDQDERVFLATEFPAASFPAVAESEDFLALFALGPVKTKLCPPAKLRLPNTTGLPAGTQVGVFVHGIDVSADYSFAPYGGWAEVSRAAVSQDGETIETDPDEGLPFLSVIGIR